MICENALDTFDFSMSNIMYVKKDNDTTEFKVRGVKNVSEDHVGKNLLLSFTQLRIEGYLADYSSRISLSGMEAEKHLCSVFKRPVTVFAVYDFTRADRYYLTADIGGDEGIATVDISFGSVTARTMD